MPNNKDYSNQLLLDFHNQYTDCYNQRQKNFIYILSVVIIVFSAYGIALDKTLNPTNGNPCDPRLLPIAAIFACIVITYLICILIHLGWNIRKTQWVINRIRKYTIRKKLKYKIFQKYGKKKNELPDFFSISIISFEILKIAITAITCILYNNTFCWWFIFLVCITLISTVIELIVYQKITSEN